MKNLISKTSKALIVLAFLASPAAFAGPITPPNPLEGLKVGDYVVVNYRLKGFDPARIQTAAQKKLAQNLLTAETTSLKQQKMLTIHELNLAKREATRLRSANPLLKSRAVKATERAWSLTTKVSQLGTQLDRMGLLKSALAGEKLSPIQLDRIRLHEFHTLRSVTEPSAVKTMATRFLQKEASILGASVTNIEKFAADDLKKAMTLQSKTRMRLGAGALVAGGIVAFVMYSNFEVERTEARLVEE